MVDLGFRFVVQGDVHSDGGQNMALLYNVGLVNRLLGRP